MKILLADDSVTMHRAVSLALKKEPYELICVDNGKDALRLAREHRPQILLLDLDMPEMTGIEVAQEIRGDASLSSLQLVLLCGSFDEINEKDIEKAPVDARLWKPFESHVLLAMIRTLLSARPNSTQAPSLAAEHTAPQSAAPRKTPPPRIPLPKSRKDEAIQAASIESEERSAKLPSDSTEQRDIREASEATRPLTRSVSDLFDPTKRPAFPELASMSETPGSDSDFTHELARETFGNEAFPEELPPRKAVPPSPPVKEDSFANNLWSPEELSSYEEETSFESRSDDVLEEHSEEPAFPNTSAMPTSTDNNLDFEILDPHRTSSESMTSAHRATPGVAPWTNPESQVFENLHVEATREIHSTLREQRPEATSSLASDDLRKVVAEEVKRAFDGWLRDELQRQLDQVISELDGEPT